LLRQRLREQESEWANERERAADGIAILYGGSVKADNAKALFSCANIDGALVGGASLKADEFLSIANA
jgi:triosephosphate isomerase